jgi:hypothetical protein
MKTFRIRFDIRQDPGTVWVDDVTLHEAVSLSEWEAWQELGMDKHSLIADPLFVDPDKDDYRLRPDSPAFKLGFQPIPVEKIGPYKDDLRASWPIVEAEGAREKPLSGLGTATWTLGHAMARRERMDNVSPPVVPRRSPSCPGVGAGLRRSRRCHS